MDKEKKSLIVRLFKTVLGREYGYDTLKVSSNEILDLAKEYKFDDLVPKMENYKKAFEAYEKIRYHVEIDDDYDIINKNLNSSVEELEKYE